MLDGDVANGDDLLPRYGDILAHGAVALHTQRLVVLTGVVATVLTRRAVTAVGIGIDGNRHTCLQVSRYISPRFGYLCTDFMSGNHGHFHHRVQSAIGVQVASAKTYVVYFEQHLVCSALRFLNVNHLHFRRCCNLNCFHLIYLQFYYLLFTIYLRI